jgi:tetraacyldisaccharide-1-P 4'-kinase
MQRIVSENQLEQIITTEKDAVKLLEILPKFPLSVPVFYRPLEVVFPNLSHQQRWLSEIESALKS